MPAVSRLETQFGGLVDFIHVDWEDPDSREVISVFGAPRRSTYYILDPTGEVLWTFVGRLDADAVAHEIEIALDR